jgi:hypothetical protein
LGTKNQGIKPKAHSEIPASIVLESLGNIGNEIAYRAGLWDFGEKRLAHQKLASMIA